MRINRNKREGKNTMKGKNKTKQNKTKNKKIKTENNLALIWTCTLTSSSANSEALYHWAMRPLHSMFIKNQFNFKTALKYFSLPFTLFGPCGAVIIINSKMNLRKKSLKEYFKTISHCFRVYPLSGFISTASSSLLSLKFRSPFFRCYIFRGKDFQPLVQSGIGLQPAVFFFFFFFLPS